ncbi:MAG: U32 family peptidase C-terminal domain-containing protein [Candidatus Hydromicrobium sp.]|nr:U32 family peptidase C-terminal domain-containing protein [Candidatus Hydromicrobium sp.]
MLKDKKIPELLVPANNLNILKYAVNYGADAVYVGGKEFNLRSIRGNFSIEELEEGVRYAHKYGVKLYFTLNSIVYDHELARFREYLNKLKSINLDGIIISDFGALELAKEILPGKRIHISTQTNINNHPGVNFFEKLGASRVNLAREINFSDLKNIIDRTNVEIEIFIHGALCISYSGRCMLSKYMTGRDANRGECAHSCRWKYYLMEEERANLFFPVEQDNRGTYIYNSRDLCLLPELKLLVDAGVDAFKIEGRMKTENYVSLTTWVYRRALDYIAQNKFTDQKISYLTRELDKCSHRNFTSGFMFLKDRSELEDNDNVGYIKKYRFIGVYHDFSNKYNGPIINVKNQFKVGEVIDILQPYKNPKKFMVGKMISVSDNTETDCANPNDSVIICDLGRLNPFSIFRIRE